MAHKEQADWVNLSLEKYFHECNRSEVKVLDIGSLDINGNNRTLVLNAANCQQIKKKVYYTGIDITAGNNVDIVGNFNDILDKLETYDLIISTEALEHDRRCLETLNNATKLLKDGGTMIITAAGFGRAEHGTTRSESWASPGTNDYYKNVTAAALFGYFCNNQDVDLLDYQEHYNTDIYFSVRKQVGKNVEYILGCEFLPALVSGVSRIHGYCNFERFIHYCSLSKRNEIVNKNVLYIDTTGDDRYYKTNNGDLFLFSLLASQNYNIVSTKINYNIANRLTDYVFVPINKNYDVAYDLVVIDYNDKKLAMKEMDRLETDYKVKKGYKTIFINSDNI